MPELLVLVVGLALAAAVVLAPLLGSNRDGAAVEDDNEAAVLRHRVALEALRDVEADRRAGSLDDAAYAAQLAEAEGRAAATAAARGQRGGSDAVGRGHDGRRPAVLAAALIGTVLLVGWAVPEGGVANRTVTNEPLAAAMAAEEARQDRIRALTDRLADTPDDADTLSSLADAYLAGSTAEDLAPAAGALQLLIALEPERGDAYERIIGAYLRAGDTANARAAHTAYADVASADPIELAFFDGLVARAEGDAEGAVAAFDRFLELAPDDPRAEMIAGLRDEASR